MSRYSACVLIIASIFLVSCSRDNEPEENRNIRGNHVWKQQVGSMGRARDVEDTLSRAVQRNKDNLEQQTQ